MQPSRCKIHRSSILLACLVALTLTGCVTLGDEGPNLPAAALPVYEPGDAFLFTSDRWKQVLDVRGETVVWAGRDGGRVERTRNFVVTSGRWRAAPSLQAGWVGGPDTLWPLRVGASAKFIEMNEDGEREWQCRVTGTRRAEVPAGAYDVFRVRCLSGVRPETVYEQVWYFAPEIGHYVFHLARRDGRTLWRDELVAHVPDLSRFDSRARSAVNGTFQDALEKNVSGREKVTMLAGGAPNVAVTPLATFRNDEGRYCRTYRLALTDGSDEHRYPGMACRSRQGVWRIP